MDPPKAVRFVEHPTLELSGVPLYFRVNPGVTPKRYMPLEPWNPENGSGDVDDLEVIEPVEQEVKPEVTPEPVVPQETIRIDVVGGDAEEIKKILDEFGHKYDIAQEEEPTVIEIEYDSDSDSEKAEKLKPKVVKELNVTEDKISVLLLD
jgi:hypothetical protein